MNEWGERLELMLSGELDFSEEQKIRKELQNNPSLLREFKFRKFVNDVIYDTELAELNQKLSEITEQMRKSRDYSAKPVRRRWYITAAAVSTILVSGVAAMFLIKMPPTTDEILNKFYEPAKAIMLERSSNYLSGDTFKRDLQLFVAGNYAEASRRLLKYSTNPAARFYASIALMETGQYVQAETLLKSISSDPTNLFSDQAQWYLGLCLLKNNKIQEAREIFTQISTSQSLFNDKANEVLKRLN